MRNWEPKAALVPPGSVSSDAAGCCADADIGDVFYPRLLDIADLASVQIVLFEVAGLEQAMRVADMVGRRAEWDGCEVWKDWPGQGNTQRFGKVEVGNGRLIAVKGEGNGRAVLAWREEGGWMLGRENLI